MINVLLFIVYCQKLKEYDIILLVKKNYVVRMIL